MKCDGVQAALSAYVDKELFSVQAQKIEEHLRSCADCSNSYRELSQLGNSIKSSNIRYAAPTHLRQCMLGGLRENTNKSYHWFRFLSALAYTFPALLVGLAIGWATTSHLNTQQIQGDQVRSLLSAHIRSLMVDHLTDIASSDSHTVKPWFHGRLDFSPPAHDLTQHGYPLIGGRLEYVAERSAAALVYRHRQHTINLFVWPKSLPVVSTKSARYNGYNIIHWDDGHLSYWAISDLNIADLEHFRGLLNDKTSPKYEREKGITNGAS